LYKFRTKKNNIKYKKLYQIDNELNLFQQNTHVSDANKILKQDTYFMQRHPLFALFPSFVNLMKHRNLLHLGTERKIVLSAFNQHKLMCILFSNWYLCVIKINHWLIDVFIRNALRFNLSYLVCIIYFSRQCGFVFQ
jgi:hypothetical protein